MSKGTTEPRLPLQALVPRILLSRRPRSSQHARVTVTVAELAITSALAFRFSEERFLRAPPTSVPSSRQRDHYKHTRCLQLRSFGRVQRPNSVALSVLFNVHVSRKGKCVYAASGLMGVRSTIWRARARMHFSAGWLLLLVVTDMADFEGSLFIVTKTQPIYEFTLRLIGRFPACVDRYSVCGLRMFKQTEDVLT